MAAGLGLCLAGAGIDRPAAAGQFDGVTVNIMTFTGPQIAEPLQRRAPDFEKLTGAKVNVITVPFSDLYQKLLTDWAARHQQHRRRRLRAAMDGRLRRRPAISRT